MRGNADLPQKLIDDKVFFAEGSMADISQLSDSVPFSLNCINDRYYEAEWSRGGKPFLTVLFPISFELLLGMPKSEIEKLLADELADVTSHANMQVADASQLVPMSGGVYRTNPKRHYQLEALNDCRYYRYADSGEGFVPIFDSLHIEPSAINLFHFDCMANTNYQLHIEQGLYGFKSKTFQIGLWQWIACMQQHRMTVYVAVEEELPSALKMLVVAECRELGFNHLLSVEVPKDFVSRRDAIFEAKLNAYIPTHNVKDLYQKYKHKSKRDIKL